MKCFAFVDFDCLFDSNDNNTFPLFIMFRLKMESVDIVYVIFARQSTELVVLFSLFLVEFFIVLY